MAPVDPPLTTSATPGPLAHEPDRMVGGTAVASVSAITARLTLDSGGVCWHVEPTHSCTGTFGTETGPALPEANWAWADALLP
jgi:hypothetical protein